MKITNEYRPTKPTLQEEPGAISGAESKAAYALTPIQFGKNARINEVGNNLDETDFNVLGPKVRLASYIRSRSNTSSTMPNSLDQQRAQIVQFLNARYGEDGYELEEFVDLDCSGSESQRAGLNRMIEVVGKKGYDFVVATHISRIARSMLLAAAFLEALRKSMVGLLLVHEPEQLIGDPFLSPVGGRRTDCSREKINE
jgi:hypothetical protein